jgi:hypothetical protein
MINKQNNDLVHQIDSRHSHTARDPQALAGSYRCSVPHTGFAKCTPQHRVYGTDCLPLKYSAAPCTAALQKKNRKRIIKKSTKTFSYVRNKARAQSHHESQESIFFFL